MTDHNPLQIMVDGTGYFVEQDTITALLNADKIAVADVPWQFYPTSNDATADSLGLR